MGLFVYTQKGSIISMVDLPTTEIIEPAFCDRLEFRKIGHQFKAKSVIVYQKKQFRNPDLLFHVIKLS